MFKKIAPIFVFVFSGITLAGPLGLEKGMSLDDLKKQGAFTPTNAVHVYTSKSLLRGHPDAELYSAIVSPTLGLCKIVVATKDINTNSYGTDLIGEFNEIKVALSNKYGNSKDYDFLRSGSIWNESRDWMMGLAKKDRTLSSFWTTPENSMPDSIKAISLEAISLGGSKGFIRFGYEFDNISQCLEEMKAKSNANL